MSTKDPTKAGKWLLQSYERKFVDWLTPKLPLFLTSKRLTITTCWISLGILICSYFAATNIQWLWGASALIALQWLTDSLDGAVGRFRNEGLVKWGYYMDHFLDYLFLCSILIGYAFILPLKYTYFLFFMLALCSAFMINSFLAYKVQEKFKISYAGIGPTEIRIVFIIINTLLTIYGQTYLAQYVPYVFVAMAILLAHVVYHTQAAIFKDDMLHKRK